MEEEGGERKPEYRKETPDTQFCGGVTHTENVPRRDLNLEFIPALVTSECFNIRLPDTPGGV